MKAAQAAQGKLRHIKDNLFTQLLAEVPTDDIYWQHQVAKLVPVFAFSHSIFRNLSLLVYKNTLKPCHMPTTSVQRS